MQNLLNSRYLGIAISLAILTAICYYFSDIVSWLVIAWVISLLGSPLMALLGRIKIGKFTLSSSIRAIVVLTFFYLILGLFFYILVPIILQQGRNLAGINYAVIAQKLDEPIAHAEDWLVGHGLMIGKKKVAATDSSKIALPVPIQDSIIGLGDSVRFSIPVIDITPLHHQEKIYNTTTIQIDSILQANGDTTTRTNIQVHVRVQMDEPKQTAEEIPDTTAVVRANDSPLEKAQKQIVSLFNPSQISKVFSAVLSWFGNFLVLITSVTFIAFFFLKDEQLFGRSIKALIPDRNIGKLDAALVQIRRLLTRYFTGILAQMLSITIYLSAFLGFCGVQNAILIATFAALMNVIPYVGPLIGMIFGLLITISSNLDADFYLFTIPLLVKVFIAFFTMQVLDNFILQPVIFSNSVMAHPLEIFIVVVAGANIGGVTGMVIAVPAYTILRVIAASFFNEFKWIQQLTGTIQDPVVADKEEDTPQPPVGDDYAK